MAGQLNLSTAEVSRVYLLVVLCARVDRVATLRTRLRGGSCIYRLETRAGGLLEENETEGFRGFFGDEFI
jgi:hypothetical protein